MTSLNPYKIWACLLWLVMLMNPAYAVTKICLAGSDVATLPSYGQSFLNGARLAQAQSSVGADVEILTYFYDRQPLEVIRVYNKMRKDGCNAIIGFDSLTDVLLVAQTQKPPYTPIFTTNSSTVSSETLPNNFFVAMPSYNLLAKNMISFLVKRFGYLNNVLLISEVNRNEMLDYKIAYSQVLTNMGIKFDTFNFLEGDTKLNYKIKKLMLHKQYKYIFVFATANDGAAIANANDNKNAIYIGTEFFGSSATPSFNLRLKNNATSAYIERNLDFLKSNLFLTNYENSYYKKFKVKPTVLSAYSYDETNIILKTLEIKKPINVSTILSVNYNGITGIRIKNGIFYRSPYYVILSNTSAGYQYVQ